MRRVVRSAVFLSLLLTLGAVASQAQVDTLRQIQRQDTIRPLQLQLQRLPELEVTDLVCQYERDSYYYSTIVRRVKVTLRNNGSPFDGDVAFRVVGIEQMTGGESMEANFTARDLSLAQGQDTVIWVPKYSSFQWPEPWNEHPVMHFFAYTDPENAIRESREDNNTFTKSISFPHIEIVYPNGGEVLEKGKSYTIRWTSERLAGNVKIQAKSHVLPNGSASGSGQTISHNAPNTGRFVFTPGRSETEQPWLPAGYWRLHIASLDDPFVSDSSDGTFVVVPKNVGAWWELPWSWNPQNLWAKVTKAGRIKPRIEYTQMIQHHQAVFQVPEMGADMDLDFQIPVENFGSVASLPLEVIIRLSNDVLKPGHPIWNQHVNLFQQSRIVRANQGFNKLDARFQLSWYCFSLLEGLSKPITVTVTVRELREERETLWEQFETYMRFMQEDR